MNLKAIADAIAATFVGTTATVDGVTEIIAIGPTASLPNSIGKATSLLVFPPTGELEIAMGPRRRDTFDFPVRLLRDPVNYPSRTDWLYAWATAIRDKVETNYDLGLAYVAWAEAVSMAVELDGYTYGDSECDEVLLTIRVRLDEIVATVSI
jgi:hypothetical protein